MSPTLAVERYTPDLRSLWDETVRAARTPHFMFERAYMDYHADRFDDSSLIVMRGDRPIAAFPASRHGDEVVSHGGLTFGGLIAGHELTIARAGEALAAIAATLAREGTRRLIVKPVPHIYHAAPAEEELYALHGLAARLVRRDASAAVAPGSTTAMSSERRRALGRARAAGVSVAQDDRLDAFLELVSDVLRDRHDTVPVHTPEEMRSLVDAFPAQIRLFTATLDRELIAGVLVYETPMVAHAQYIAASPRGRELGGSDAVFSHLLSERYRDRWVDFGISNERDGSLNAGLMRNKEGFGARAVMYDRYAIDLA